MSALDEFSTTARSVLAHLGGAIVTIGRDGRGSGLVIAAGKVLTNAHNLRDQTTQVTFADGRAEQGSVTGADEDGDLVVLDVDTGDVSPATWAEQLPEAGDVVFALSRGGHRVRISFGMVSSVDVAFHGPRGRQVHGGVEHTAPLVRGASGGPVADAAWTRRRAQHPPHRPRLLRRPADRRCTALDDRRSGRGQVGRASSSRHRTGTARGRSEASGVGRPTAA